MAAMFTDDPNELNKRYMPKEEDFVEDEGEEIPEEELTEEEKKLMDTIGSITEEDWKTLCEWFMDEEDYTLSEEEYGAKNIIATLNTTNPNIDYDIKLGTAKSLYPDEAFHIVQRLKKKPEEGVNIPPELLEIIYAKAKEYKG